MSGEQFALWLAGEVKAGMSSRSAAITCYRSRYGTAFMEALTAIDMAIGDWNEGKRFGNAREAVQV